MDIVQFLFSVVNLLLALVVLFGGRFFMRQIDELKDEIEELHEHVADLEQGTSSGLMRPLKWNE